MHDLVTGHCWWHDLVGKCLMQGANVAAVTMPDDKEAVLLAAEEQAQWNTDNLVQALEEAKHKCDKLATKRCNAQATREKREADQHEADVKVRGRLLANAAMAEVRHRYVRQANKVRLALEKLRTGREVSQSLQKVWMRLGVSLSLYLHCSRLRKAAGYCCTSECSGRLVETEGAWLRLSCSRRKLTA